MGDSPDQQHIRHGIQFAWDMFDSEIVILKCDRPSGEHVRGVLLGGQYSM